MVAYPWSTLEPSPKACKIGIPSHIFTLLGLYIHSVIMLLAKMQLLLHNMHINKTCSRQTNLKTYKQLYFTHLLFHTFRRVNSTHCIWCFKCFKVLLCYNYSAGFVSQAMPTTSSGSATMITEATVSELSLVNHYYNYTLFINPYFHLDSIRFYYGWNKLLYSTHLTHVFVCFYFEE